MRRIFTIECCTIISIMKKQNIILFVGILGLVVTVLLSQFFYPSVIIQDTKQAAQEITSADGLAKIEDSQSETLSLGSFSKWQAVKSDFLENVYISGYVLQGAIGDFMQPIKISVQLPYEIQFVPFVIYETDGVQTLLNDIEVTLENGVVHSVSFTALGAGNYYLLQQHLYSDSNPLLEFERLVSMKDESETDFSVSWKQNSSVTPYRHDTQTEFGFGIIPDATKYTAEYVSSEKLVPVSINTSNPESDVVTAAFSVPEECSSLDGNTVQLTVNANVAVQELQRTVGNWMVQPTAQTWTEIDDSLRTLNYTILFSDIVECVEE